MIEPITSIAAMAPQITSQTVANPTQTGGVSFDQLIQQGIQATDTKIAEADRLVTAFTLDNDIPAHQVMFALEQARLSLEMMVQVRNRVVEGFQQIMNMQV